MRHILFVIHENWGQLQKNLKQLMHTTQISHVITKFQEFSKINKKWLAWKT